MTGCSRNVSFWRRFQPCTSVAIGLPARRPARSTIASRQSTPLAHDPSFLPRFPVRPVAAPAAPLRLAAPCPAAGGLRAKATAAVRTAATADRRSVPPGGRRSPHCFYQQQPDRLQGRGRQAGHETNAEQVFTGGKPPPLLRSIVVLSVVVDEKGENRPGHADFLRDDYAVITETRAAALRQPAPRCHAPAAPDPRAVLRRSQVEYLESWLFRAAATANSRCVPWPKFRPAGRFLAAGISCRLRPPPGADHELDPGFPRRRFGGAAVARQQDHRWSAQRITSSRCSSISASCRQR